VLKNDRVLVLENDRILVLENDRFLVLENDRHPTKKWVPNVHQFSGRFMGKPTSA
jgi:hypothetical protein